jgi:hypothetical protein
MVRLRGRILCQVLGSKENTGHCDAKIGRTNRARHSSGEEMIPSRPSNSQGDSGTPTPVRTPRICMPSGRLFKKKSFLSGHYEAQDVLQEVDDLDLIYLEPGPDYAFKEKWQRRLLFHDFSRQLIFQNPGLKKVRLTQEYDLFLAVCQFTHDFVHINAIEGWEDHCKVSVCWIDELWVAELQQCKYWLHALKKFDHVFVSCLDRGHHPICDRPNVATQGNHCCGRRIQGPHGRCSAAICLKRGCSCLYGEPECGRGTQPCFAV